MPHTDPARRRACDRERFRRRTAERLALGFCPRCGERPPAPERSVCETCAIKQNKASRARDAKLRAAGTPRRDPETARAGERARRRRQTAERVAAGLCTKCGKAPSAPERRQCEGCIGKRRAAERNRYAVARAAGKLYGGANVETLRHNARVRAIRRHKARLEASLCARCGKGPPAEAGTVCEPCKELRRDAERAQWAARRAAGCCGKCGAPVADGKARCTPCADLEAKRQPVKNAANRNRYARRRALGLCTDCGGIALGGAARCDPCAWRSYARSDHHRGMPVFEPRYTVIELGTGMDHGTWGSWAEVAACIAFARLTPDDVEVIADEPMMAGLTGR